MTNMTAAEAVANFDSMLNQSQAERVVIERNGKPIAIVVGVEDLDAEDVSLAGSAEFWQMIADRRQGGGSVALSDLKAELGFIDAN